jgi:hypothetical protein
VRAQLLDSARPAGELAEALEKRELLELRAMIRPTEDLALYRADMARWDGAETGCGTWPNGSIPVTRWSPRTRRGAPATSGGCGP